jgi:hypothetical protein
MSILSFWVVDSQKGRPYNPPIAEAAARKRGDERSKPLKSKRNFGLQVFRFRVKTKVENRVLTDGNVSNTTRHVDDDERQSLPLSASSERAEVLPGNRTEPFVPKN